jgi:hypothetical protein
MNFKGWEKIWQIDSKYSKSDLKDKTMFNSRDSYDLEKALFKHYKIMFKIEMFPKVMNFKIYKTRNILI